MKGKAGTGGGYCPICGAYAGWVTLAYGRHHCRERVYAGIDAAGERDEPMEQRESYSSRLSDGFGMQGASDE